MTALVAATTLSAAGSTLPASTAVAAIGPFSVSPSSGPPGTSVTVSGAGCGPGLFASSADYVSISSTTLPFDHQTQVSSSGSWSTSFTVPAGSLALPAAIVAACFTDGLPSLTTIYTPGTFTVTAATTPPTPPPPDHTAADEQPDVADHEGVDVDHQGVEQWRRQQRRWGIVRARGRRVERCRPALRQCGWRDTRRRCERVGERAGFGRRRRALRPGGGAALPRARQ